jgi:two-component system, LytTR family, sensor kinase
MNKILLLLLCCSYSILGQNKDSLLRLVNTPNAPNDTLKCRRYVTLIDSEVNIDGWYNYNIQLGQISASKLKTKLNAKERQAYINFLGVYYNNTAIIYSNKKQLDMAEKFYQTSIKLHKIGHDDHNLSIAYQNLAITYNRLNKPAKNIEYSKKALQIVENKKDSIRIAAIYGDIGYVTADNGAVNLGVDYLMKSIQMAEKIKATQVKMRTLKYLVTILTNQKEHEKALHYLKILNTYFKEKKAIESLSLNHFAAASVYQLMGDTHKMFENINTSIALAQIEDLSSNIAANYGLLAKHYLQNNSLDSAYKYSNKDVLLRQINNSEPALTKALNTQVSILNKQKKYAQALELGQTAYKNAKVTTNLEMIMMASANLKETYQQLNNKVLAKQYASIEQSTKDSLDKVNTKNSALKAVFKYESEQQESKIALLSQEKQISKLESQQKSSLIFSLLGGLLAVLAIGYFSFTKYKTKKENELLQNQLKEAQIKNSLEQKAVESELKAIKSQMNPHFMFNALNNIQQQFMYGNKELANEQMGNFTDLTRKILANSGKKAITLAEEIETLEMYLNLEKVRFENSFEYQINIDPELDEDYQTLPPMIVQPFVENAIKHGFFHKVGDKKLVISFDYDSQDNLLICTIKDNGIGRNKAAEIKQKQVKVHESFSSSATEERLKLMSSASSTENMVSYQDLHDPQGQAAGTVVTIKIPLA